MNKSLPLVTVIIPCYNHEHDITICIESIYRQTYQNIEVIVIDDDSTDGSVAIIEHLNRQYSFEFIKHSKNIGLIDTLNEVIHHHANGKYIKAIAGDDYLPDDSIMILVDEIEKQGASCSFVYGKAQSFKYEQGKEKLLPLVIGQKTTRNEFLFGSNKVTGGAALFNKEYYIKEIGMMPNIYVEDLYMWIKLSRHYQFSFVDKVVSYYQMESNTTSMSKNNSKMIMGVIAAISINLIQDKLLNEEDVYQFYRKIDHDYVYFITTYLNHTIKKDKKNALKLYIENMIFFIKKRRFKTLLSFWIKLVVYS